MMMTLYTNELEIMAQKGNENILTAHNKIHKRILEYKH